MQAFEESLAKKRNVKNTLSNKLFMIKLFEKWYSIKNKQKKNTNF